MILSTSSLLGPPPFDVDDVDEEEEEDDQGREKLRPEEEGLGAVRRGGGRREVAKPGSLR